MRDAPALIVTLKPTRGAARVGQKKT